MTGRSQAWEGGSGQRQQQNRAGLRVPGTSWASARGVRSSPWHLPRGVGALLAAQLWEPGWFTVCKTQSTRSSSCRASPGPCHVHPGSVASDGGTPSSGGARAACVPSDLFVEVLPPSATGLEVIGFP